MAITKTTRIESIHVSYPQSGDPVLNVNSITTWDDPNDDALPISKGGSKTITKMTTSVTYDTNTGASTTTESATDYSGEDEQVIAVCDLVWPAEAQ